MEKKAMNLKNTNRFLAYLSFILSTLIAIFVYFVGGTSKVYANLMYIPIALISSTNGIKLGVLHAILSAIMVGPFMPLDSNLGLMQEPINWILRLIIYLSIAFIIGYFSEYNKKSRDYATNLLTHDMLTGFRNIESLKNEENHDGYEKTVIALSVNEYEEILGFFGYGFTNRTIKTFSEKIKEELSEYENVEFYRYDGMDFILIITHDSKSSNIDEIIDILKGFSRSTLNIENIPIYIEMTMGITKIDKDTAKIEGLRQAMISLRYAIANNMSLGIYDSSIDTHYKNIISIASNFGYALSNGNIKVVYQNIYDPKTGKIHGVELLARWVTDNHNQISPNDFIPVIEKTELIGELTKFMIDTAIDMAIDSDSEDTILSINFSPKDFKKETIDYLIYNIKDKNINPRKLQIEITEEILLRGSEAFCYLELFRKYGILIAIDDFGTGYSSYQSLAELPIDVIKIDKSMIQKVSSNTISKSLVKSIVDFCQANDIITVAEGVETKEMLDTCNEIGIDYLQGYYFHKPEIIYKNEKASS